MRVDEQRNDENCIVGHAGWLLRMHNQERKLLAIHAYTPEPGAVTCMSCGMPKTC